jgi:hypothetical protein
MPIARFEMPDGRIARFEVPAGLSPEQAQNLISQQVFQKPEQEAKPAGFSLKDLALSFGQGVGGGTQALTDIAGAGNVVSKGLTGLQEAAGEAMSPERQAEIMRRQEIKKKAEGNTLEEVKAVLGGFAEAPLQTLAQGAGSIVPMVLGTALMPAAAVPAAVARLTAMGVSAGTAAKVASSLPASTIGAMMGVGGQKGQDYETVKRELLEKQIPEAEAERLAQKAAEYSLENAPRQIASGGAGALAGGLGVESLVGRIGKKLPEVKGPSLKLPEPTVAQAIGRSTAAEALPEALQSAVSTVGTNVALNQAGVERDLTQGVLANAINDALVGGVLGAGASPLKLKEMRQQYVQDEFKGQQEYQKQQQEEIAANQKKIKDELDMTQNPLGMLTVDDLGADLFKVVQQNRADTGKPALTSFSLDDVVDALPSKDKESLNAVLAAKTGYTNEVYTPAQVIEVAQAKNVETGTQGFSDFLSRTTGLSDPAQMSQPQLHAAITSLAKLPGFTSTQSLPEGLNATNYTPKQFTQAIDGLNAKMDALGADELTFKEAAKAIETATGLRGSAVNALVNDAARKGDVVADNNKVSVPSRTTPTGYGISEEVGAEQEQAKSYEVRRGDEILDEHTTKESADQQVEGLNKLTAEEIKNIDESLKTEEAKISKAEKEVQRLILAGNRNTPEFKAAQDAYEKATDEAFPRIAELKARKESYQTPLSVAPIGVKKVKPKSYVVRKGQGIQTVKQTREEAEQAIFEDLSDADLQELSKKRSPALQKRVNAEIQRRAAMPAKSAPATATTPEQQAKLDKLKQDLPAMLERFGLKDVGLKIVDAIEGGAEGSYAAKVIEIALDAVNPVQTLRHEAIHALKELGFFTPQQWAALERQAKNEWVQKYLKDRNYRSEDGKTMSRYEAYKTPGIASKDGLTEEDIIEEAIADAFGDFDATKAPPGMLTALLNKLRNFFSALRSYLNGQGFQTYKDVFAKIEAGELKGTAPVTTGEAKKALKTEKYGMLNPAIQPKYEKVLNDIIDEMEVTPEELASTSLLYQTGKAGIEQFEGPDIGRLPAVVQHLQDLRRQSGLPLLDTEKPEDRKTLARLMTIEAMAAIRSGGANLEWYDSVINKTLGMAGLKYAELNTDPNARSAFRVGMAITSQGLNVEDNLAFAMKVYDSFRTNQRFPEIGQGADQGAMVSNFKLANALLSDMGPDLMRQFLETEFTVDEMRSAGFDIKGELKDEKVLGSSVFGPKIGFGFYSNLNGNFEPTTMDMWFMRTIGRLTGKLKDFDPELYKEQLGKFRNALNVKGDNGVFANQFNEADVEAAKTDDDAAEALARKVKSAHERDYKNNRADYNNKTREKSKLVGAAESMINSLDKPRDAPASGSERRNLRDVVRQMVDMVEKKYGKRVPPASLQAAIWYPEQELYKALGVRLRVTSQSYAGAMEKILTKEGYDAGQLSTAAKSGSRTTQRLAYAPVAKRTQATGTQPYRIGPLETQQREEFLEKYRTKSVIEQEREAPRRKKVVFEVAPDPNNVELSNRWRNLDQVTRLNISEKIARSIVRKAMADFDVDGYIAPQVGSYMDDTNPSFALFLNSGDSVEISKFIGYALSQDSMMVISPKPAKGLDKVSAITVDLNTQDPAKIDKIYQELRKIKVDGETPIGGQTTMNGKMILLNYSNVDSNELASLIDDQLKGDYNISVGDVYSAFPEKESYNYANPSDDPRGERGTIRERSRSLRDEATRQLQAELGEPTSQRGRRKLSLPLETEAAKKSENLRGIISDETLYKVQEVLNTYTEKPKNLSVTPEQRAKAEQALMPYVNKANAIKPKFDQQIRDIAKQVDGEARIPGLKGIGRAAEKLILETDDGMAGNPKGSDIMDLLRATIVVNSESQIQPTLELIKKKFPQVLRVKDRFTKPQDTGYRDILMNVKLPNGLAVEIQLNIPEMIKAKTSGHVLYAMSRNLVDGDPKKVMLDDLSRDLYSQAYRFAQNAISPSSAGSALANVSGGTGISGLAAKTTEPSLSSKTGVASSAQTLAPSGTLNIPASSKDTSIEESKKSLKSSFRSPEAAENAAYKKAPPTTEAFKRWFGGSVLTEEGRPMVMYHGSPNEFSIFSENRPIFVSSVPDDAGFFAALKRLGKKQGKPYIYPLWVRAEKPFDFENPDHVQQIMDYMANNYTSPENANRIQVYGHGYKTADELSSRLERGDWTYIESANVQQALQALGFDSFQVLEGGKKNLAVFSANQVKSATGNLGDYSESKDIRYSLSKVKNEVDSLPNGAAINASINRLAPGREQKGYIERILEAFTPKSVDALRQQFLNRYNQLGVYDKEVAKQMGGAALLADSSAESAALMSDNAAAIASMACGIEGKGGIPVFDKGYTTISNANGEKGVLEILMPLAKIGDPRIYQTYQFWAGSLRGSRLLANGTDHTYTKAEIDYAKELLVKYPEFKQVQEDWIKYNNGLMKYAVSTGVLSPEKAAEFMKYSDYIPFYRQIDGEKTVGPRLFQNISGVTPPKKLKGLKEEQDIPFADFLETIVRNTQSIIQSGMKNTAAQRAIGQAMYLNVAEKRQDVSYAPGVVTVLENGKPVSYDVADQLFVDAVKSLNLPELPFLSFFAAPANLLRNLVTKDPGFMMANLMRDSLSAWVTSGAKMTPIASTIANFGRAIGGTDPVYLALRNAGVIGGYEFAAGVENSGVILGESLRRATGTQTGTEKALKPFTSLWRGLEKGTEASDAATRMAVYKATLEKTGNEAEAIYRAMEVMNFNRKGNLAIVRILTAAVPFLNARMQGLDVFYRAAFGKMATADAAAIQKSFFIRGATLMALTSMYWFLTHDEEEYLAQEQETRDNNWLFPSAGIRIPIPFEVGVLFKVVPERMLEYAFGSDTGEDMANSFKRNLINTFAFNPIPQTVLPLVEARTNYSFFTMRDIVSQGMENVAKEYQVAPNTSEAAKKLGKALGESPIIVDHIMKGYTGSLGMYAIDLIDAVLFSNGDSPKPAKRFEQMPVIKRFALDKQAKGNITAYYELKNSVDEVVRTVNIMEARNNAEDMGDYIEKNAHLLGMKGYISSVEKQMKVLREASIQIRSSDMSADEKMGALLSITEAQNAMTSSIREIKKSIQP